MVRAKLGLLPCLQAISGRSWFLSSLPRIKSGVGTAPELLKVPWKPIEPALCFVDFPQVVARPLTQGQGGLAERPPKPGQCVFHLRGTAGKDGTRHESIALQGAQRPREHLLRYPVDAALHVIEAPGAGLKQDDDEQAPFVADAAKHAADAVRALQDIAQIVSHADMTTAQLYAFLPT